MTRIAVTADTHADQSNRWDEHCRIMDWLVEDWRARDVEIVVHTGDHYEARSTPIERAYMASWIQRVASTTPVITVAGNHGDPADVAYFERLDTEHLVIAADRPRVVAVNGIVFSLLPWPRKANLLAQLGAVSPEESGRLATEALRNIIRGLGGEMDRFGADVSRVFVGHCLVDGSVTSLGQPLCGHDMAVCLSDLGLARAHAYLFGHIHRGPGNEWNIDGAPAMFPGAPWRGTFGDTAPTGYVLLEIESDGSVSWERIPTPSRSLLLIGARVDDVECPETGRSLRGIVVDRNPEDAELRGAEIRLRYRVASDERELGAREAESWRLGWLGRGAAAVKVEPEVIAETRARAPEIAAARDLGSKLAALWAAKGVEMDEARAARLIERAHGLEEEVANAA